MGNVKARLARLEKNLPKPIDWGGIFDMVAEMDATVPSPDGEEYGIRAEISRDEFIRQKQQVRRYVSKE